MSIETSVTTGNGPNASEKYTIFDTGIGPNPDGGSGYFLPRGIFSEVTPVDDLRNLFREKQSLGESVMVLDIMGQARAGLDLNADRSVGWTRESFDVSGDEKPGRIVRDGDLLDESVFGEHLSHLQGQIALGNKLRAVFFRPAAGFDEESFEELLYFYEKILRPLYEIAEVPCHFLLAIPMPVAMDEPLGERWLEEMFRAEGFSIRSAHGMVFDLIKTKDSPKKLPSMRVLSGRHPRVASIFQNIFEKKK